MMAEEAKQEEATQGAEAPGEVEAPEDVESLTLEAAQAWKGLKLDDMGGASVGRVEGVYVDEGTENPEWLLARMGRFGHHSLVPARDAVAAGGHVWVPYTRDQIRKAPRVEAGKPLDRDAEQALLEHFGVGTGDAGRGAELAKRDAAAVTAKPATP